ncbi:MAG: sugar phosphate nucleotidyltransferase [Ignavibacteria bacterium]|nr:sugar phosphate nucleotidyltransferase [Ignavibacteria bacterium]
MRAIIPVAGLGSRLRPHTYTLPKVLLSVAGKPILAHIIDKIIKEGITSATLVVGHMGDMIRSYLSASYPDFPIDYVEQEEHLGLGHAIYISSHTITSEPILIILGDTIFDVDLKPVLKGRESALGVKEVEDPRRFGVAETVDGYIVRLVEKPEKPLSHLAVVGLYYITNTALLVSSLRELVEKNIRTKNEYQLTDALQMMLDRGEKMKPFTVEGWYDCGKPDTLLSTNKALLETHARSKQLPGVILVDPVYVSPTAKLTNCVIGPYTTVGKDAVINESIVRNSIISEGARVHRAMLDNSIVGNGSVVKGNYKRINVGGSSEIDFY